MRSTLLSATVSCLALGVCWYAAAGTVDNGPWPYGADATLSRPAHVQETPAIQRGETHPKAEPRVARTEPRPVRAPAILGSGPWPYGENGRLTAPPQQRVINQGAAGERETGIEQPAPAATCKPAGCGAKSSCCGTCKK